MICLLAGLLNTAVAQTGERLYSAQELKEDFTLMQRALTERHPDLYGFVPRDTVEQRFRYVLENIRDSMSLPQAFELFAIASNRLGCGHTSLYLPGKYMKEFYKREKQMPFKFRYREGNMYITRCYLEDTTVALGWRVEAIDGHPADQLVQRFLGLYSSDGYNQTLKHRQMELSFRSDYAMFIGAPDSVTLECVGPGGARDTFIVPTMLYDTLDARFTRRWVDGRPKERTLEFKPMDSSKVAILGIGSFMPRHMLRDGQRFKPFIRRSFRKMRRKGINDLVIDLRNNPGGYSNYGIYLYSWLADSSFRYFKKMELPTRKPVKFIQHTDKTRLFNLLYLLVSRDKETGLYQYKWDRGLRVHQPRRKRFEGNVYILINGNSFSNSSNFSALAHYNKRAVFIGEETGGRYDGCNGSAYLMVTLPNTGLKLNVPLVKNCYPFSSVPAKGRGIMPDHPVQPAIDDLIKGVDAEMNYTMKLIMQRRKSTK